MELNSDSEWLIVDLYDLITDFSIYEETTFSNCAHEFFNTKLFRKYNDSVSLSNIMYFPTWMWYTYIDLFFEKMCKKFTEDHIILNRFRSNDYYLDTDGIIKTIPDDFRRSWFPQSQFNSNLRELEDYIIKKYNPYVIDISKHYMCDANDFTDLNGAHFEISFYHETHDQIKRILEGKAERYWSDVSFFTTERRSYEKILNESFNVEENIRLIEHLLEKEDILWLNVLDRCWIHAPNDERVIHYMQCLFDN